jgi:hypothetical protein
MASVFIVRNFLASGAIDKGTLAACLVFLTCWSFTLAIVLDISVCTWKLFDDGPVALGCSNCMSMSIAFISLVVISDNYRRYNM